MTSRGIAMQDQHCLLNGSACETLTFSIARRAVCSEYLPPPLCGSPHCNVAVIATYLGKFGAKRSSGLQDVDS